jgi:hypothetical protein
MATIVFKPGPGVDGLSQPGKLENEIFEVLIFHIKKIKKQFMWI